MELFIPFQSNGHVLLTTYAQAMGSLASPIPVPPMTTEDSALFLLRRARIIGEQALPDEASETAYAQAALIVQEVDGLSLALDQAGAYIEETGCDLGRYLGYYREKGTKTRLLGRRGQLAHAHPVSVKVTLSLAFEEIAREHSGALDLLHLCAFLHPDAIPREMIEQGAFALSTSLRALASDTVALDEAIAILRGFSLVQYHTYPTMLGIHRVVQAILREELMRGQPHRWASQAVRLMSRVFPDAEFSNWSACEQYFVQARRCAELITEFQITQKEAAHLLQHLGSYCYQRAYYQDAERHLTTALHLYEQSKRPDQEALAQTLNNLALVYHKRGKYQEAEEFY
ncbi:MAG: tetratricopeptide repeat protein, partial [Ktedonobacteraceae bacterium]